MIFRLSGFLTVATLALAAMFSTPTSANDRRDRDRYDRDDDRYEEVCRSCGTVRGISRINRSSRRNVNATVLGALIGGAIGNQVGSGDGRRAATVVGAVAGGAIANDRSRDRGGRTVYRISVRMDTGRVYTFDQERAFGLRPGSRVEVRDGWVEPLN